MAKLVAAKQSLTKDTLTSPLKSIASITMFAASLMDTSSSSPTETKVIKIVLMALSEINPVPTLALTSTNISP